MRTDLDMIRRFWSYVDKTNIDSCWLWKGTLRKRGGNYGQFSYKDKCYQAHRISWEIHFSEIPKGLFVCHHCDNPSCVNPSHLWLGTAEENSRDMWKKGRHPFGGRPKILTDEQVATIISLVNSGLSYKEIAEKYKVHPSNISNYMRRLGKSKHITSEQMKLISSLKEQGCSQQDIACKLKLHQTTISRAIRSMN